MKNNQYKVPEFFCVATTFLVSTALNATGISPIKVTLSSGLDTNYVKISAGQLKVVEYKIQDMIGRPPSRTWLWSPTMPSYVARAKSLHQPDCAMYNQPNSNPNTFTLPPNGVCYFAIQIDATQFIKTNQGSTGIYRPTFINSDAVEYGPCESEGIYTTLVPILPIISVGTYNQADGITQRPLLALSQNSGSTWGFPQSINAPVYTPQDASHKFVGKGVFYGASCSNNICIAVGEGEEDSIANRNPLLAVSQNSGDSWIYPLSVVAPILTYQYKQLGEFKAASCDNSTCIAAGDYRDTSDSLRALLAFSQDSGSTWNFADTISNLVFTPNTNQYASNAWLKGANCNKNTCITVGEYQDTNGIFRPLFAQSNDSGTSWTYAAEFNDPVFYPLIDAHPFQNNGKFNSVSCNKNTCIAVGNYNDTNNIGRPLLALSQDAGNTWGFPAETTDPKFTPSTTSNLFANDGSFEGASCYNSTCVAIGYYQDSNGVHRPLLGQTKDSGNTWQFPSSINEPVFAAPNDFDNGGFSSVSCYGTTCIAVGGYFDVNLIERPLLASSQDLGETWTYSLSINAPVFTPSNANAFSEGRFYSASCNATACIASGDYNDGSTYRPLLAWSQDSGNTWTYPSSTNAPIFTPKNMNPFIERGFFNSALSSSMTFLPDSLKILNRPSMREQHQDHISKSPV